MKLYSEFARVYHDLYALIVDYAAEFEIYEPVLAEHACHKVVELGCGTGLLAQYCIAAGLDYLGVDNSEDMLAIARETVPEGNFVAGDMRFWGQDYDDEFDAVLVPGNTFSHLTTNADVFDSLTSIAAILKPGGLLLFDALDARTEFRHLVLTYEYDIEGESTTYHVASNFHPRFDIGWAYAWNATYNITEGGQQSSFEDEMIVRTFFQDELRLMLELKGFEVLSSAFREDRSSFVNWVAQKQG
jgi:SAM-dependent methyltransferase